MDILGWLNTLPGAAAQGMIWGIMAIGVFITYKILDIADLTVDGSICTGAAVSAVLITNGINPWVAILLSVAAGMLAGLITGLFHAFMGIPAILSGILTQLILWSLNLKIMGKANIALSVRSFNLIIAQVYSVKTLIILAAFVIIIIALLYWFFGTELGASLRATGNNLYMSRAQALRKLDLSLKDFRYCAFRGE